MKEAPLIVRQASDRDQIERRFEQLHQRRQRTRDAYLSGRIEADEFDDETDRFREQRDRLEVMLKDASVAPEPIPPSTVARLLTAPDSAGAAAQWLRQVVERIDWDGRTADIRWILS